MMKKLLVVLPLVVLMGTCNAKNAVNVERVAKELGVVRYVVTIYKESKHDTKKWQELIQKIMDMENCEQNNVDKAVNEICELLRSMSKYRNDIGIHCEVAIGGSNGECAATKCGDTCTCHDRYAGMCPCSVKVDEACSGAACDKTQTTTDEKKNEASKKGICAEKSNGGCCKK